MKPTIYAACWLDGCLGGIALHLKYPTPEKAIENARSIAAKGAGKVWHVRAVELTPDDQLIDLIPPLNTGDEVTA